MQNIQLNTVEYYDGVEQDRLIGAVYVPEASAIFCAQSIGHTILRVMGGNCLRALLLNAEGALIDELAVHRKR